jgi:hypothetical protein
MTNDKAAGTTPAAASVRVPLDRLVELPETKLREVDQEHAETMALFVDDLPPIDVVRLDDGTFGIRAGYHRTAAHRIAGKVDIAALVWEPGSRLEHIQSAVLSNRGRGLRLTPAERRHAAYLLIAAGDQRSNRAIAHDVELHHATVQAVRAQYTKEQKTEVKVPEQPFVQLDNYPVEHSDNKPVEPAAAQPNQRVGEDGKRRAAPGQDSQDDRMHRVLSAAPDGLTTGEVKPHPEVADFVDNHRRSLDSLVKKGRAEKRGKRGRGAVYYAIPDPEPDEPTDGIDGLSDGQPEPAAKERAKPKSKEEKRLQQFVEMLMDTGLRRAAIARSVQDRELAKARKLLDRFENDAYTKAREADQMLVVEVETLRKNKEYWKALITDLARVTAKLAMYTEEYDDMPAPQHDEFAELRRQLEWYERQVEAFRYKLFPDDRVLVPGRIIDLH